MVEFQHELRPPVTDGEWRAFHAIRRRVLFENRGKGDTYIENHPDDFKPGHHPLIVLYQNVIIGVIRVEIADDVAWFRRVAIREDLQRSGHGRVLLRLAEAFAKAEGCTEIRSNAAVEAVGFYERCGYERDLSAPGPVNVCACAKLLLSRRAQKIPSLKTAEYSLRVSACLSGLCVEKSPFAAEIAGKIPRLVSPSFNATIQFYLSFDSVRGNGIGCMLRPGYIILVLRRLKWKF